MDLHKKFQAEIFRRKYATAPAFYRNIMRNSANQEKLFRDKTHADVQLPPLPSPGQLELPFNSPNAPIFCVNIFGWKLCIYPPEVL